MFKILTKSKYEALKRELSTWRTIAVKNSETKIILSDQVRELTNENAKLKGELSRYKRPRDIT